MNFGHARWLGPAPVSMMPAEVGQGVSQEGVKQVVVGVEFEVEEHVPGVGISFRGAVGGVTFVPSWSHTHFGQTLKNKEILLVCMFSGLQKLKGFIRWVKYG